MGTKRQKRQAAMREARRHAKQRKSRGLGINKVLTQPACSSTLSYCLTPLEAKELGQNGSLSHAGIGPPYENVSCEHKSYPQLGYLWVYEPQDLEELTLDEVKLVWQHREQLCGSREAAAEALALIEVISGEVETYQGWLSYLQRDEVHALTPDVEPLTHIPETIDQREENLQHSAPSLKNVEEFDFPSLRRIDLIDLTHEELQDAWDRRPESFFSLEAACGALAMLRALAGIEIDSGWQHLMHHSEILKLTEDLPDLDNEDDEMPTPALAATIQASSPSAEALLFDQRTRRQQHIVVREGQPGFRKEVLANYDGRCCITGCLTSLVLEAAHISPYSGPHSNHAANGLCLRVDIHRLFDGLHLSIDPETRQVVVAPRLTVDPTYQAIDGKRLKDGRIPAAHELLTNHYLRFLDLHPEAALTDSQ